MSSCPHCHEQLSGEIVAQFTKKSTMTMRLVPQEGQMLEAKTVGGTLNALSGLLAACGKEAGVSTITLVKSIATDADGAVEITLLSMRLAKGLKDGGPAADTEEDTPTVSEPAPPSYAPPGWVAADQRGANDFAAGKAITDCPFSRDSDPTRYHLWRSGWRDAAQGRVVP